MLCLARLRSAISFASLFGVSVPTLIGLCALGGLGLNLAGDDDTPPRGCAGLVYVDWRDGEGMFEVAPQELLFSCFYRCPSVHG